MDEKRIIIEPPLAEIATSPLKKGRVEKHVLTEGRKASLKKATEARSKKARERKELKAAQDLIAKVDGSLPLQGAPDPRIRAPEGQFESAVPSNAFMQQNSELLRHNSSLNARLLQLEQAQTQSLDLIQRLASYQQYGGPPEVQYEPSDNVAPKMSKPPSLFGSFYKIQGRR